MKPLHEFTAPEADRYIISCRRSLAQQAFELRFSSESASIRSAMNVTCSVLCELAVVHPSKRGKIEALIARYAP